MKDLVLLMSLPMVYCVLPSSLQFYSVLTYQGTLRQHPWSKQAINSLCRYTLPKTLLLLRTIAANFKSNVWLFLDRRIESLLSTEYLTCINCKQFYFKPERESDNQSEPIQLVPLSVPEGISLGKAKISIPRTVHFYAFLSAPALSTQRPLILFLTC